MNIHQRNSLKLEQHLLAGFDLEMVQNLSLLDGVSFAQYVEEYCTENPALLFKGKTSRPMDFDFSSLQNEETLYSHLAFQIEVSFNENEKQQALEIAASLDSNGFYFGEQSPVLKKVQLLDPVGIGAKDVREALLVQLKDKGMDLSLSYKILNDHYKLFLLSDRSKLCKCLKASKEGIDSAILQITQLNPYPGRGFGKIREQYIRAEMILEYDDTWHLSFVKEYYPSVELVKNGNEKQIKDAKRFIYQLNQRKKRLEWIVSKIVKRQEKYLLGESDLNSLNRREVLKVLDISESTFSRILSQKYIKTPVGTFSLAHFFTRKGANVSLDTSIEKAKKILYEIIEKENKKKPYADEILCKLLLTKGIVCSRRGVAKYRKALSIPGAYHRASK